MRFFITSTSPAAALLCGENFFRASAYGAVFRLDPNEIFIGSGNENVPVSALLVLTPISQSLFEPLCAELLFTRAGRDIELTVIGAAIRVVDWSCESESGSISDRIYELIPEYTRKERRLEAEQLDRLEYERNSGKSAEVFLYRDCGLRLGIHENGQERGYILGSGEDGKLRIVDAGFARLLAVHLKGCIKKNASDDSETGAERLCLFNEDFELFGEISGDRLYFEDGYLVAINELGTVLAHQQMLKYEIAADGVRLVYTEASNGEPDECAAGEIGWFTHPKQHAKTNEDAALALMECILIGREDGAMALLSPSLAYGLDFEGLFEFFGDFDEARKMPCFAKNGSPVIGAVRENRAKAYAFDFENGLINDISEFEPPASRHSQEGVTE